ncbi:hypothetical protein [Paenibacillus pinisoli]|uniref:hypothetical protein n=1 Tax=Paenibacillus pinisoli TaxID=1276110 RepID=UPI001403C6E2|nr:hypothetical protein [Paenibacillus pinisoli]
MKKVFSDDRWNDTSAPKVIGERDVSDEEQSEHQQRLRDHLKKIGIKSGHE